MNRPAVALIGQARSQLSDVSSCAQLDAEMLLAFVCGVARHQIYTIETVTQYQVAYFWQLVARRSFGEPVAFILGKKEFFGHEFQVNSSTMVPRCDTESLVETVIAFVQQRQNIRTVLDVGTGSGAILISVLSYSEKHAMWGMGVESSQEALDLAKSNARRLLPTSVNTRIRWVQEVDESMQGMADVVMSNPPYVNFDAWCGTASDVHVFEPERAILVKKPLLEWIDMLSRLAKPGGRVFLEWGQTPNQTELAQSLPPAVRLVRRIPIQPVCCVLVLEKRGVDGSL